MSAGVKVKNEDQIAEDIVAAISSCKRSRFRVSNDLIVSKFNGYVTFCFVGISGRFELPVDPNSWMSMVSKMEELLSSCHETTDTAEGRTCGKWEIIYYPQGYGKEDHPYVGLEFDFLSDGVIAFPASIKVPLDTFKSIVHWYMENL